MCEAVESPDHFDPNSGGVQTTGTGARANTAQGKEAELLLARPSQSLMRNGVLETWDRRNCAKGSASPRVLGIAGWTGGWIGIGGRVERGGGGAGAPRFVFQALVVQFLEIALFCLDLSWRGDITRRRGKPVEAETFELDEHLKAHASHTHDLGGDTLSVGLFVLVLFSLRNQLSLACYVPLSAHIFHRLGRGAEGCTRLTGRAPNLMPPSLAMRSAIILRRCNLSLPDSSRREGHWCRRWYGRKGSVPLMADDEQGLAECWAALSECGIRERRRYHSRFFDGGASGGDMSPGISGVVSVAYCPAPHLSSCQRPWVQGEVVLLFILNSNSLVGLPRFQKILSGIANIECTPPTHSSCPWPGFHTSVKVTQLGSVSSGVDHFPEVVGYQGTRADWRIRINVASTL
ncbi:hypothetical protein DFH94DRAFT_684596 [Russula ochroleuca]|uniref:Uncharacterized protein n=1 Tax=Russula ochroleuca TaxID=152965 RepID=A0A9P5MQB9_9AGAM|nr:hypothetical protein DFH94DRAFT_684596 [Russula ochroleuca]